MADHFRPRDAALLPELLARTAARQPDAVALTCGAASLGYGALDAAVRRFADGVLGLGLQRAERVGIYLEKRLETVVASFGAPAAGGVFVPLNPLLKPEQAAFVMQDCDVRVLVTSPERLALLAPLLAACRSLRQVVLTGALSQPVELPPTVALVGWDELLDSPPAAAHRVLDVDMAAILYTSGSTGTPKGVVLSHRNMVFGAKSVASYLGNGPHDSLLAALPLSFDAGFSQLTTGFASGARVVLLNYLLPRDVMKALQAERITGLTAVPPLYIQLAQLDWPAAVGEHLRYFANTGGRMPRETLDAAAPARAPREALPDVRPDRGLPLDLPAAGGGRPPARLDRQGDSRTPRSWCCARTARRAPPTSRANWCTAARWSASATGTTPRRRPSATGRCRSERPAAKPGCSCPSSPSGRATPCAATPKASCTSSAGATR